MIVGPTGSGKTDLSISVARHFDAPIISTDSRQFYRGIPIGTAQPSPDQLATVEHHMIACRELEDEFNSGAYEIEALKLLEHLFETHDNIVAVGGSGLYIKALCEGLDTLPDSDPEVREAIRTQYANEGLEPLLAELQRFDPAFWEVVDRCNPSRVMRALEVCRSSGATYSELRKGEAKSRPFEIVKVGIDIPRNILYDRINRRVEIMVSEGLEAEARSVYHLRNLNSLQTVGYREMFDYFDGTATFEEAVELIKRNSRRYAKRQMTWFRRDADIQWFTTLDANDVIKHL